MAPNDYVFKTVQHGTASVDLTATVHVPEQVTTAKGIALYFHGGGYIVGNRGMLPASLIEALHEAGLVAVSSDYRLCPTISVLEGPVADSIAAYEWAQNELPEILSKEHNIKVDGKNIVTLGHSCGGGLALLMASRPHAPKAIMDMFGFKFLRDPFFHTAAAPPRPQAPSLRGGPSVPSEDFINKVFEEIPPPVAAPIPFGPNGPDLSTPRNAYLITSVQKGIQFDAIIADHEYDQVDAGVLLQQPNFPPTFFVQGTADTVVDAKLTTRAYQYLQNNGVNSQLALIEGAPHGFDARLSRGDERFASIQRGVDFLASNVSA